MMKLETTQKLLRFRDFLQAISQISFSYTTLNKQYPMNTLSESESEGLSSAYLELVKKVSTLSNQFESELEKNGR